MKNVRENQLKTCIFLSVDELQNILCDIYQQNIIIHSDLDGCWYESDQDLNIDDNDVCAELSKYFETNVTSIHIDDCESIGVWVCYKEEK